MKTIKETIKSVATFLSTQDVFPEKQYRRISFCFIEDIDGTAVAYNSLTGEMVELNERELAVLQEDVVIPSDGTRELIEKWFLVPTDHNDIQLCDELRDMVSLFKKENGIHSYTIFTTMDCNARCFYCYEMGRPRIPMSEEVAEKTAEFIKKNSNGKAVRLAWFGGEPLCNIKVIDIITERLREAGVEFKSVFTSNGSLFEQDVVDKAVEKWNIKNVQITLDGTEDVYNRAKAYMNSKGKNPFVIVTDNIERLLKKGVSVVIRMNMGTHNKDDLFNLVDWTDQRYKGYDNLSMYPHLLFDTDFSTPLDNDVQLSFAKDLLSLEKYCMDKDRLSVRDLFNKIRVSKCMADSSTTVTITPQGYLGKCEHFSEDEFVGTLDSGITDLQKVADFKEKVNSPELCQGCHVYPLCVELKKCPDKGRYVCSAAKRYIQDVHTRLRVVNYYKKLKESK